MASERLTQALVAALPPKRTIWDTEVQGLGVRRQGNGLPSFVVKRRIDSRQVMITLGSATALTVKQAREAARARIGDVARGINPNERKAAVRAAERARRAASRSTLKGLAEIYVETVARPRLRSWTEVRRIFNRYIVPRLGARPVTELGRRDIARLADEVAEQHGPVMAQQVLAQLRRLLNWHETRVDDYRSPFVRGMNRVRPADIARDRVLSDPEIRALWFACDQVRPEVFGRLVRFLLLTGQRRSEATGARWTEIQGRLWTIPAERYKTKQANQVPLSDGALHQVVVAPRLDPFVFSTTGDTPFQAISKAKTQLDGLMQVWLNAEAARSRPGTAAPPLAPWRLHDLRRTARTLMARAGVAPHVAERVLGHRMQGVEAVYDRHDYQKAKQHALDDLGKLVAEIVADTST